MDVDPKFLDTFENILKQLIKLKSKMSENKDNNLEELWKAQFPVGKPYAKKSFESRNMYLVAFQKNGNFQHFWLYTG